MGSQMILIDDDGLPAEEWREVPSIPGLRASSHGRVMLDTFTRPMPHGGFREYTHKPLFGVVSSSSKDARHLYFGLYYGSLKRNVKVHFAVCEAFHGKNPTGKDGVRHLNENGLDNRPSNLRWSSQKVNLNDPEFISYLYRRVSPKANTGQTAQEKRAGIYDSILDIAQFQQKLRLAANDNSNITLAKAA